MDDYICEIYLVYFIRVLNHVEFWERFPKFVEYRLECINLRSLAIKEQL